MIYKEIEFSIIIPTYNNVELLQNAIKSILTQVKIKFEIIIVDDSNDNRIELYIKKLNYQLIKYFPNIPSLGAVKNWNSGLVQAQGKYLILLHHDEYFFDNECLLYKCISQFTTTGCEAIILNSIVTFIDGSSKKQRISSIIKKFIVNNIPSLIYSVNIIGPTSCVIFKKDICIKFNEDLKWLVDVDWYYRMLKGKKIIIDNNLLIASIHGHENQITNTLNIKEAEKHDQFIIRNNFGIWSSVSAALYFRNCLYHLKGILFIKSNPFWRNNENC